MNKNQVVNENLYKLKNEILINYHIEFEMVDTLKVGDQIRQTHIRFRNISAYESSINSIDEGYDADNDIFLRLSL